MPCDGSAVDGVVVEGVAADEGVVAVEPPDAASAIAAPPAAAAPASPTTVSAIASRFLMSLTSLGR